MAGAFAAAGICACLSSGCTFTAMYTMNSEKSGFQVEAAQDYKDGRKLGMRAFFDKAENTEILSGGIDATGELVRKSEDGRGADSYRVHAGLRVKEEDVGMSLTVANKHVREECEGGKKRRQAFEVEQIFAYDERFSSQTKLSGWIFAHDSNDGVTVDANASAVYRSGGVPDLFAGVSYARRGDDYLAKAGAAVSLEGGEMLKASLRPEYRHIPQDHDMEASFSVDFNNYKAENVILNAGMKYRNDENAYVLESGFTLGFGDEGPMPGNAVRLLNLKNGEEMGLASLSRSGLSISRCNPEAVDRWNAQKNDRERYPGR